MEMTSPELAAEAIMSFVDQAIAFSQAAGFGQRTFAAHVLLAAVEQVDLDQPAREAFLAIADQLSQHRPLERVQEMRIRRQRQEASQAARRARRLQRIAEGG